MHHFNTILKRSKYTIKYLNHKIIQKIRLSILHNQRSVVTYYFAISRWKKNYNSALKDKGGLEAVAYVELGVGFLVVDVEVFGVAEAVVAVVDEEGEHIAAEAVVGGEACEGVDAEIGAAVV